MIIFMDVPYSISDIGINALFGAALILITLGVYFGGRDIYRYVPATREAMRHAWRLIAHQVVLVALSYLIMRYSVWEPFLWMPDEGGKFVATCGLIMIMSVALVHRRIRRFVIAPMHEDSTRVPYHASSKE